MSLQTPPPQPAPPATPPPSGPAPYTQQPFMVQVSRPTDDGTALKNLIVGSFGLTGALVIGALVCGVVVAGVMIAWRKFRGGGRPEAPPTIGQIPLSSGGATRPPSSQDQ